MKYILLFISIIFLSCSNKSLSDLEREGLTGSIECVTIKQYKINNVSGKYVKSRMIDDGITEDGEFLPINDKIWFDKKGNKLKEDYLDFAGNLTMAWSFKYENDFLVKSERFDRNYAILAYYVYKYTGGRLTDKIWYSSDSIVMQTKKFTYNVWGTITTEETYQGADKTLKDIVSKHTDKNGNIMMVEYKKADNNSLGKIIMWYSSAGILIEKHFYNKNTIYKKISFKYKFDTANNWITRIKYVDNVPVLLTERTIVYYK